MALDGLTNQMSCDLQLNSLCDENIGMESVTDYLFTGATPNPDHVVIGILPNLNAHQYSCC